MVHKTRRQRNKFECTHVGFGKYCHRCKDEAAGRIKPKKKEVVDETTRWPDLRTDFSLTQ